ncbi:hypothetical protein [Methylobacterium planeticum]|uniref:Uncharacterized protein n=1 Tax=Methylobacterium planeticum TaxID=2615211 RepID=A0A6N6MUH6_9HYPH|nr:hypothetical protein [Methylobacterium planeticum]KAB1072459.1 hypothetical protein F6X51_15830 [Methylobacterium planeticum]
MPTGLRRGGERGGRRRMGGYWINVFRRPDGRLVAREDLRGLMRAGRIDRRGAEAPMQYQGQCRFLYRVRISPRGACAAGCGRVHASGFVGLSGSCPRCGLPAMTVCAAALRAGLGEAPAGRAAGG